MAIIPPEVYKLLIDPITMLVLPDTILDENIKKFDPELVKILSENKIIVDDSLSETDDLKIIQDRLQHKRIGILYLILSDHCNLACRYCFVENAMPEIYAKKHMSVDIAQKAIDLFAKCLSDGCSVDEPQIILYGGEPFINPNVLEFVLGYITKLKNEGRLPNNTSVTVNTNGTLITKSMVDVLKGFDKLTVALSLDGPKSIHDLCRPYHNGKGTFEDVMRVFSLLKSNGINPGLCCTISKYNVDDLLGIAKWFVTDLGIRSLGFNIMIDNTHSGALCGDVHDYAVKVSEKLIECFKYFREVGVYEDRMMRKVNSFVDGMLYLYDCGGCGQQIVIAPDGSTGVCQGYLGTRKYFLPPEEVVDPLSHEQWSEWRLRSPLNMSQCSNCIALGICGGGCPFNAHMRNGSIWSLDEVFCVHAKASTKFLIDDLVCKMQP